jgi:TIR domain
MRKVRQTPSKESRRARRRTKPAPPKVFLSHASEDKERFVLDFASRLRERGVDVWLDRWEMLPGDSLVDKIFEEGLAEAKAVIVVISERSIAKRWVREELNAAVVKKINTSSKLIPVVIDDCRVPNCLQATIWEKIDDLKNYEPNLDRIVLSIFGQSDKPPVGEGPSFTAKPIVAIGDLTPVDSLILQTACESCLEEGYCLRLLESDLLVRSNKLGISEESTRESVDALKNRGYLKHPDDIQITTFGFGEYLKLHRPDYESLLKQFASRITNEAMWDSDTIGKSLNVSKVLLDHIVDVFKDRKWIIVEHFENGRWEIAEGGVSPEVKRWLES